MALNTACGNSTGSNRIEKGKFVNLLDLFQGRREKGLCDLLCGVLSDDWAILVYVEVYSPVMSVDLILWGAGPILRNGCGFWGHNVCIHSLIHSFIHSFIREMSAG